MKLCVISDTHGKHKELTIPQCDTIIHCGDFTNLGRYHETTEFMEWFDSLKIENKILIAGNHDLMCDPKRARFFKHEYWKECVESYPFHYLLNNGCEIDGVKFWGSPITPWFHGEYWAFNKQRGEDIDKVWQMIPNDTDVLITHGPPKLFLDRVVVFNHPENMGCEDLGIRIGDLDLKIHCFGHLHLDGGQIEEYGSTKYINAAMCDEDLNPTRKPIIIEI